MLGRTHLLLGLFLSLLVIYLFNVYMPVLFVVILLFASVLPDIDEPSSFVGKFAGILPFLFGHRGFFHSAYAAVIFSFFVFLLFGPICSFGFLLAYLAHLFLDSFTRAGISFFMMRRRIKGPFSSGGFADQVIQIILLFLNLCLTIVIFF